MKMQVKRFIIGTRKRPTVFLTYDGTVSEDIQDVFFFDNLELASDNMHNLDEPELFKVYDVDLIVNGL